jgi:hypothetical protein|tara:strand:+ start:172 stop:522 length:351 start_codon:yes stop_codon:yes gene_type:complete
MAQFIKFPLTGSQEELLIPISEIANVETVTTTSTKIELANGTKKFTITHLVPLVANSVVLAILSAMTANPGGVVSTVVAPLKTAQVPAAQSGQSGKILITQQAEYATFTSIAYGNV